MAESNEWLDETPLRVSDSAGITIRRHLMSEMKRCAALDDEDLAEDAADALREMVPEEMAKEADEVIRAMIARSADS